MENKTDSNSVPNNVRIVRRVKTFFAKSPEQLGVQINKWIEENENKPYFKFLNVKYSVVPNDQLQHACGIALYEIDINYL